MDPVRLQHRQGAQARAHADAALRGRERGDELGGQGVRVALRCGVRLVAPDRLQQRGPHRRQLQLRDCCIEHARQRRELGVLWPVVHDEERQRAVVPGARRPPQEPGDLRAQEAASEAERLERAAVGLLVEPHGRVVARELEHRFVAERPGGDERVGGICAEFGGSVGMDELQQVLDAVDADRPGQVQLPRQRATAPAELGRIAPLHELGAEADCAQAARTAEGERDLVLGHARWDGHRPAGW